MGAIGLIRKRHPTVGCQKPVLYGNIRQSYPVANAVTPLKNGEKDLLRGLYSFITMILPKRLTWVRWYRTGSACQRYSRKLKSVLFFVLIVTWNCMADKVIKGLK
jgi:hypothetical protein